MLVLGIISSIIKCFIYFIAKYILREVCCFYYFRSVICGIKCDMVQLSPLVLECFHHCLTESQYPLNDHALTLSPPCLALFYALSAENAHVLDTAHRGLMQCLSHSCLAYFTNCNYFKVHSSPSRCQRFLPFNDRVTFYGVPTPHFRLCAHLLMDA